ncbi:alpha-soluble NSF attachment protein-like isoform X2 [Portunus trituberculatus]|uniref:alpha-soluble NSF attachment protein-like isoform X2 n=1 Tax=Portunus trituberculatus TaxID=210409 RepID=UPI001E1CE976|nr:alpha-soluble NSF attachment protein-like isoform X2 [Portunus trituberculatus]
MADAEQKAMQLMAEAEKKLSSSKGFLGSLFGGSSKVDEAMELYQQAANKFKMAKKWSAAAHAFTELASLYGKAGSRLDAATNYVEAGNCYKKTDPNEAVNCLLKAIEIYTDMGKFVMAAKHHQSIGEIYETEGLVKLRAMPDNSRECFKSSSRRRLPKAFRLSSKASKCSVWVADIEKAIQHFEQASDYFRGEENNSSSNKCLLKVAMYAAQMENYEKAIQIYEQVATSSLESSLLKYSAKEYMFRATLCHLVVDVTNAKIAVEKYEEMYPAFQDSRECKLLKALMTHLEEQNVDAFTDTVKDYDSISRLDQWYTTMLLRIKKTINAEDIC